MGQPINYYVNTLEGPMPIWTRTNKIPIERIFNVMTDTQEWYLIPGYPGYEISNLHNIRSFKYLNQYRYGTLMKVTAKGNVNLTDLNNIRCKENVYVLWQSAIAYFNKEHPYGYPKRTFQGFERISARNQRKFIDNQAVKNSTKKIVRKPKPIRGKDDTLFTPHFTVVKDEEDSDKITDPLYFF